MLERHSEMYSASSSSHPRSFSLLRWGSLIHRAWSGLLLDFFGYVNHDDRTEPMDWRAHRLFQEDPDSQLGGY